MHVNENCNYFVQLLVSCTGVASYRYLTSLLEFFSHLLDGVEIQDQAGLDVYL